MEEFSYKLQPLTKLAPSRVKNRLKHFEQKAFNKINCIVDQNNLLYYPDFNNHLYIQRNASEFQLIVVISQK